MHFVMKVSKLCNLRCRYCYEYEELGLRERMPLDGLDFFFQKVADWYKSANQRSILRFVLHGGEPLLLPESYLREFSAIQHRHLTAAGVPFQTSLQTNLTVISAKRIELLEELNINLGISLDVFGSQRVDAGGHDSQRRVLNNLQFLFDTDAIRRLSVGAISVLHRANVKYAVNIFQFYRQLGLSYRILPIFSLTETLPGISELTLSPDQVLTAFKAVARAQFAANSDIIVYPLYNYIVAAVNYLAGAGNNAFDPRSGEWALIVNTNGDVYNHAESYSPLGLMGNIFRDTVSEIMAGSARQQVIRLRQDRARLCEACKYGESCSRLPIVEGLPSERGFDNNGNLICNIAKPMIDFMIEQVLADPAAGDLIKRHKLGTEQAVVNL